jgi:hypothetical protein
MGTWIPGIRIQSEYPGIYRVVLAPYPKLHYPGITRIRTEYKKIPESVSKKRVFTLSVYSTQRVYSIRFHP